MHIPSARVHREMLSEETGTWVVPAIGNGDTAILIKAPSSTLKALVSGAKLEFVFGVKDGYLCCGTRIFDVPDAPVLLCSVQRHLEEHEALTRVAKSGKTPVFLYNELDVCVAWSGGIIESEEMVAFQKFTSDPARFYSGPITPDLNTILDKFEPVLEFGSNLDNTFELLSVSLAHGPWTANIISFAGTRHHQTVILTDANEGGVLEKTTWASLESVFPLSLYHSPQVHIGNKSRELTDVLAFYEYGTFFFESKDLSVIQAGIERGRERRLKGTQKQAHYAIEQLVGASKAAKRGEVVTDSDNEVINLVLDKPIHCIALLTELMHEGDWSNIEKALINAMIETGDFFHLFDLREFITLLKASNGEPHLFDYNLIKRCERFVESRSVHMRSRMGQKKPTPKGMES